MLHTGLVSVTFRKLQPKEIIKLVSRSGLDAIEWGGDIHVPHGDTGTASLVARMTVESGLKVSSYGSYYIAGSMDNNYDQFKNVLESAIALNAPTIRVWAGNRGSADSDTDYRKSVIEASINIAQLAAPANIEIAYEFHGNTLTDTYDSAASLLEEVSTAGVKSYWQPQVSKDFNENIKDLKALSDKTANIHVFHWKSEGNNIINLPLSDGNEIWHEYFGIINTLAGSRYALLEFVKDESQQQFLEDAQTLKRLINGL